MKQKKATIMEFWDKDRNMLQIWWLKKSGKKELLREVWYKEKPWVTFPKCPVTPDFSVSKVPYIWLRESNGG
jgi:hypothetical protein